MDLTDSIVLCLSIFFVVRGASRGFINSLLNPFSIIVTTILSIVYYQITKDMVISLLIGLIGPLLLTLLLRFLLKTWSSATSAEISLLSRLGGAVLTVAWGWVFITFTLVLLTVLPPWGKTLMVIHDNVTQSISFRIARPLEKIFFAGPKQNMDVATGETQHSDPPSLALDPRFQNVLRDPEIQKDIDAHDIGKLMRNPKMMALTQEIMNDPATMKKVFALYQSQTQLQSSKNP